MAAMKSRGGTRCSSGVDGGQHDERLAVVRRAAGERGKRGDAPRDGLGVGRHAVVRHAVPGGEDSAPRRRARRSASASSSVASRLPSRATCRIGAPARRLARDLAEQKRIEPFGHAAGDGAPVLEQAIDRQGWKLCEVTWH